MLRDVAFQTTPYPGEAEKHIPASPLGGADGRALRGRRTRTAIVESALQLLHEGELHPSAQEIARRARISLRAVFHHFRDMEALLRCAIDLHLSRHPFEALPRLLKSGDLEQRIVAFANRRAATLERILPVHRYVLLQESEDANVARFLEDVRAAARAEVCKAFAGELERSDPTQTEALFAATGWSAWEALRLRARLPFPRAREVLEYTIRNLLAPR
jgi:TetR/AcrR family transcriptional regulator, regulator of autoinduction and epiphytic fitness